MGGPWTQCGTNAQRGNVNFATFALFTKDYIKSPSSLVCAPHLPLSFLRLPRANARLIRAAYLLPQFQFYTMTMAYSPADPEPDIPTLLKTNEVPGLFASSYIRRTIEHIDGDIAKTYGTRFFKNKEEAVNTRRTLQDAKRNYLGVLSAFRKIPAEVWTRVFSYNAEDAHEIEAYMQVCRLWQAAAFRSVIWTNVDIVLFYDEESDRVCVYNPEDVLTHFTMARPLLLDVSFAYDIPADAFCVGRCDVERLPDKSKWRSLAAGPGVLRVLMRRMSGFFFENLEEVVVRSCDDVDEGDMDGVWMLGLTRLKRLTMHVRCGVDADNIYVPWHQLTHLTVDAKYSDASDYLDILAACSANLEVCEMRLNRSPYPPRFLPFPSGSRLRMGNVTKFKLTGRDCPALFLTFLRMPVLEDLEIGWDVEESGARYSPPEEAHGMGPGPGRRIAEFIRASGCQIEVFRMQARDVWFSDVGEALSAMRKVRDVTLLISNPESMPAIDRELDIDALEVEEEEEDEAIGDDEDGDDEEEGDDESFIGPIRRPLLLPYIQEFTIHSSFFAIPLGWFMGFVQPRSLTLGEPEEFDFYREGNCVSFIYEFGSLTVASGYEGLTKEMLMAYLEGGYEGVRVLVD